MFKAKYCSGISGNATLVPPRHGGTALRTPASLAPKNLGHRARSAIMSCCAGITSKIIFRLILILIIFPMIGMGSEVIEETKTKVIVREHPKTGKPYVSIVSSDGPVEDPFAGQRKKMTRPDYRMLDPKIKSGKIPYEGPSSDRKKVYLLAASLATVGTVGGALVIAAAPAATGAGAASGAGVYAAAGGAVAAGTAAGTWKATRSDPKNEEFIHKSESKLKWSETSKAEPAKSQ